jgi:hypothetical protein
MSRASISQITSAAVLIVSTIVGAAWQLRRELDSSEAAIAVLQSRIARIDQTIDRLESQGGLMDDATVRMSRKNGK